MSDISKTQHSRDVGVNDRNTDEARAFKKTEQNIGRPELTDHNINEDVLKNSNSNRPAGWRIGGTIPGMKAPKKEELDDTPDGAMGENPIIGRQKVMDVQNAALDNSETATRNPSF